TLVPYTTLFRSRPHLPGAQRPRLPDDPRLRGAPGRGHPLPPAGHARRFPARRRAPGARREGERRARRAHLRHPAGHRRRDHAGMAAPHAPDPAGALPRAAGGGARRPGAARHLPGMTPVPAAPPRPPGRGFVVLGLCPVMWLLGDLARVTPARQLAAALLIMLVIGAAGIVVSSVGLRARRYLVDDAVPVGS